ncbi:O-acetyl-ADP-ribose deacetylase MACROD2 isoform X2 [Oryzias latipes]|nr:O-acetyl-ADP-ribose deacetylase MACROD2 isoform X2 [Oryzias latipes]
MSKKKKDWKTEKERLLRLDREVRRKEYRRQDFMPLEKIPTWREENITSDKEDVELTGGGGAGGLSDKVSLYKGDITILEVDAIVNAANSSLLGGGGVDGCIHKAAGSCLYEECLSLKGCETGKAKITCGYDLPAKYVIHTVGPVARGHVGPTESSDLASCYQNSLRLMEEHNLRTVAFPCISTGIYGFPNDPAADIALKTVKEWIQQNPDKITRVIFCVFLENDFAIYKKKMSDFFKDDTPPLSKSATKEGGENNEGEQEPDDDKEEEEEEERDDDVPLNNDVEMLSQNPEENTAGDEPNQEQQDEEKESQDKDEDMAVEDGKKDSEEKGLDTENTEDKADKKEPEAKMEEEDTANSAKDKEGVSSSNAGDEDEMVDSVEPSASAASVQPKDSAKKNE